MPADNHIALKARYIFPVDQPPVADGVLTVTGGTIVSVSKNTSSARHRDLGNVAILPGLVNAHTHLEFSSRKMPLGEPGMAFADWIREVVQWRRAATQQAADADAQRAIAVSAGLTECNACGTAVIGAIATPSWPHNIFENSALDCTVFLELISLSEERIEPLLALARQHLAAANSSQRWRPALSPHAPYTVHPDLLRQACRLSAESRVPLAMHVAESLPELELLRSASGPFPLMLEQLDAWDPMAIPRGTEPIDYLKLLATAHRSLVIHGNFLSDDEIGWLGQHANHMSVVYCPRTFAYFQHGHFPLAQMLKLGVNVAVGTDSRASNPDLNLFEELRFIAHVHPEIPLDLVLRLGTLCGARALGLENQYGSLAAGKRAKMVYVPLPDKTHHDPYELLFESNVARPIILSR